MINSLLKNYALELTKLNELLQNNYEFVFNKENLNKDYSQIKAIVVMDNPGIEEKEQKKYLVGTAGKAFNKVWGEIGLKREEVLIFNKSSLSTPSTNNLMECYDNSTMQTLFLEEQKKVFELIITIRNHLDVPLLIHGYSAYVKGNKIYVENEKSSRPLYLFFKLLKEEKNANKFTYFYKHSSYGNLSKQVSNYKKIHDKKKVDFNDYLDLGSEVSKIFFSK
ncbi:MAG: uracil-DNA glycosylase family protein [Nanoarchaeota archaeon]|nr:uracil-DNA glycosylase family protein [Nanoarchaeota archaeon]